MFIHAPLENPLVDLKSITLPSGIRHYTTPEGNDYPSITTVLGHREKIWLKDWRESLGEEKADKETERCALRGTAVHELVEKYLNNEQDFTRGYKPEYVRGFNQLKPYLNKITNIRAQEVALHSDLLGIAGRCDCVGEFHKLMSIIDFKTSNNYKDREMIEDYYLQCTAYAIMWHERTGESIENIAILMNVERGMVPLVFKERIDKYVEPLLQRIDEYKKAH